MMRSILSPAILTLSLVTLLVASVHDRVHAGEPASAYTLVRNGLLIDGTGAEPVSGGAVLMKGASIEAAGALSEIEIPSGDVRIIDAEGATITPGFIDAHVHLVSGEGDLFQFALGTDWSYKVLRAAENATNTLEAGVTTVRDLQGSPPGLKQAIREGLIPGPRIQLSVTGIGGTAGHTDFEMPSGVDVVPTLYPPGAPRPRADGPDEVRTRARQIVRAGSEVIKLWANGGLATPHDQPQYIGLSIEEMQAAARVATDYERPLAIHAEGLLGIMNAIAVKPQSIEHGFYLDKKAARAMAKAKIILVPTAVFVSQPTAGLPAYFRMKLEEARAAAREGFQHSLKAGVKIAMGTDTGYGPRHGDNLRELGVYVRWGMKPMDAIVAGTKNAAEALGWDDRIGTLEPGKLADLVIVRGNPIDDIDLLAEKSNILVVMKGGKVVKDRRASD
ncbi:MAG: amidohydrolase family protein [Myxococcota bacterium]|jgi:imidazolonepropionase-like amidohydrolase|nr:amidohydrolase family protein [Myxococcota bacterium]